MRILIASPIDPATIRQLECDHDVRCVFNADQQTLKQAICDRDVAVFRSGVQFDAEVLRSAPQLKMLVRAGSGTDNVDLDYIAESGLQFVRIPEPGAKAVAEMAFAMMLALARNLIPADQQWRKGHWVKQQMTGCAVSGKVLGIIGAGNIGTYTGRLGAAWDMQVLGCVEHPSASVKAELAAQGIQLADFDRVISSSDFICVHCPLTERTRNLIGAAELARVKPGAFLVNLARGGVVDERALFDFLEEGTLLRGAALDVHENEGDEKVSPLAGLSNVILTPHIGASTSDAQHEIGLRVISLIGSLVPGTVEPATVGA